MGISIEKKVFWRFILLFWTLYVIPYGLGFGFDDSFEEWRLWHKPIFWIGENLLGWEFDYENPLIGWDSKFEVCRYIFIFLFGSILVVIWLLLDYFYIKIDYQKKLVVLTQTILRYEIAITMLHYGLAKVFMHQFGTMDIDTLESTIGSYSPMGFMWKYLSFSGEMQMFSGWIETIGALLLFLRRTTFFGAVLLIVALSNVVLWNISFSVSVTLYAIQLLLLTLILISNQFKSIYGFLIQGKSVVASVYEPLVKKSKYLRPKIVLKLMLFGVLIFLFTKDTIKIHNDYFNNNYLWFTGLHSVESFVVNGDTINNPEYSKKWKKIVFNDIIYFNDSFKIEFEDNNIDELRFKYRIDSVSKIITYRKFEDERAAWNELRYLTVDGSIFQFDGIFESDTLSVRTKVKRLKDYTLISRKGKWLVDLD